MSNLTSNQPVSDDSGSDRMKDQTKASSRLVDFPEVPLRPGSKYIDVLLQRLQSDVFKPNSSAVIGVTSYAPRQGATTTALNLGIRAADHQISPTLVVDGNFRDKRVSRLYRTGSEGLSECLSGRVALSKCVRPTKVDNLSVLGLGQVKIARQLVMATQQTRDFVDELRDSYQLSIIDLPTINEPSLANAFLPDLDGVLIVARYGSRRSNLKSLQDHIQSSGGKVVGTVMTGNESKLPAWLSRFF